jgi:hypothetical protein
MSLTTDHHRDDLEVRRRRKQARKATAPSSKPAPPSAAAARGLLGGLITAGPDRAADIASYSRQRTPGQPPRAIELASSDGTGETSTALSSESGTGPRRSPPCNRMTFAPGGRPGPPSCPPTLRRRGAGRAGRHDPAPRVAPSEHGWPLPPSWSSGLDWVAIALNSVVGQGSRSPLNISAPRATLAAAHGGDIGLDLRRTIANAAAEVRALAGSVRPHASTRPPRRDTHPRAHRQTHPVGRDEAAGAMRTTLGAAPPSERTQPTVTQSPAAPAESTARQPVVTSHSSLSTSSSQPTSNNSATNLFGGIGSCVKGCS